MTRPRHDREPEPRITSSGVAGCLDLGPALTYRCGCGALLGKNCRLRDGKPWCGKCEGEGAVELGIDRTDRR